MQKYLEDRGEVTFEKIFSQKLGEYSHGSASSGASHPVRLPTPPQRTLRLISCPHHSWLCCAPPLPGGLATHTQRKVAVGATPHGAATLVPVAPDCQPREPRDGEGTGPSGLSGLPGKFLLWGFCF